MSDPHRECWDLLPWFVTDRVSKDEAKRLEAHLAECAECRAELDSQRLLREAMRSEDALVLAPQASFQKLMQRIDDGEAHAVEVHPVEGRARVDTAPTRRGTGTTRWLAIAACVQGVAITGLLGALVWQATPSPEDQTAPDYVVRTQSGTVAQGPVLRAVFADAVTLGQMNELLHSIDAQIVDGPSAVGGVYTLALRDVHDDAGANAVAQKLQTDPRVKFAEVGIAVGRK